MKRAAAQIRRALSGLVRSGPACSWGSRPAAAALLALVLTAGISGCHPPRAARRGPGGVHVTNLDGYLEFVARRREREQESKTGVRDIASTETIFEENLNLEADGYAYHPNLLEFALGGLFGLTQRNYDEIVDGRARSTSDDGNILEFDLTGRFLKKKKYPGLVYARRHRVLEPRLFQPSIETTTDNYGILWQYLSRKVPTRVQIDRTDVELDSLDPDEEDGRQQNTSFQFETGYNFSDHNALSLSYKRESVREQPFELEYDSDNLTLAHRLNFGDQHQHRLLSELNYFDQRGSFDVNRAHWRETLRLRHSDTLRSWYQWELSDRTQGSLSGLPPIEERSYYLAGTVEHKLYESLVSQLMGYLHRQEFGSELEIDRYGAHASFNYRKTNRAGILLANYLAAFERQDRQGSERSIEVLDERHAFRDPEPITLGSRNIDTGSIFITAENRITVYQRGGDYTVRTIGDRIEIRRVRTGQIADGQTVLIDYVLSLGGSLQLDTIRQNLQIRQDFTWGLSPYYRLRWQDQTIAPETATGALPEDVTAHTLGVEYQWRTLKLGAEFEDHDSTISPFEAFRLRASYSHRFKFGATGSLAARWSDVTYDPPNPRQTEFLSLEGRYRHQLTRRLAVEGAVTYRIGYDSLSGDDEGINLDLGLEWFIRKVQVRLTYQYAQFEDDFARNNASMIYLQVRRKF